MILQRLAGGARSADNQDPAVGKHLQAADVVVTRSQFSAPPGRADADSSDPPTLVGTKITERGVPCTAGCETPQCGLRGRNVRTWTRLDISGT